MIPFPGLTQMQDLKPLNVVLLEIDTNDLTSIIDQDKYTVYQDSFQDEIYVPKVEDIALIISTHSLDMASKNGSKLLQYFKNGGNILCPVANSSKFSSVRGICCQKFTDYQKFWIKQSAQWISPQNGTKINKEFLQSHFSTFCTNRSDENQVAKLTPGYIFKSSDHQKTFCDVNSIQQTRLLLDFKPPSDSEEATEKYLPIFSHSKYYHIQFIHAFFILF